MALSLKQFFDGSVSHLVKTFWGWRDKQLPDETVIWTSPSGATYVTTPGSALLFPSLCVPAGDIAAPEALIDHRGERAVHDAQAAAHAGMQPGTIAVCSVGSDWIADVRKAPHAMVGWGLRRRGDGVLGLALVAR